MKNSFKHYLQAQGKSKKTISIYNSYLLDFISWLDKDRTEPEEATAKEVLAYLHHLQTKGLENSTRNIRLCVIKHYFDYQVENGHRTTNPATHLKIRGSKHRKLYPILTPGQLKQLYHHYTLPGADDNRATYPWFRHYQLRRTRNKAIISLLINQGLVTTEITQLTTQDLQLREGTLHIAATRRRNQRTLPLKPFQIIELMEYQSHIRADLLHDQPHPTDKLFLPVPAIDKKEATQHLFIWDKLQAELKAQTPELINYKQIRTSVITHWLKHYNLRKVQYMAGHKYVSSTEKYLVNNTESLQADIDQYHPL